MVTLTWVKKGDYDVYYDGQFIGIIQKGLGVKWVAQSDYSNTSIGWAGLVDATLDLVNTYKGALRCCH